MAGHHAPGKPMQALSTVGGQLNIRLAAPSWVIPGNIAKNAIFLLNRIPEIGLCFFEWESCLKYGPEELPEWLSKLPFSWHIHLPLDLPWQNGGAYVAKICFALLQKTSFLNPHCMILHPPEKNAKKLLYKFANETREKTKIRLLLENGPGSDLSIFSSDFLRVSGFGICLDIGHVFGYSHYELMRLSPHAAMAHWSAPGKRDSHLPLDCLSEEQKQISMDIAKTFRPGIIHMMEIFDWNGIETSLPVLREILGEAPQGEQDDYKH